MQTKDELKDYVDVVITKYICGDIQKLKQNTIDISFPYLSLCFAGIDFLGGLVMGFVEKNKKGKIVPKHNSRERSAWFISEWMSEVNPKYNATIADESKNLGSYLYSFARTGLFHMACVQQSVVVRADDDPEQRKRHLHYTEEKGEKKVIIHALQFAEDFIEAKELFFNDLYTSDSKTNQAIKNLDKGIKQIEDKENSFDIENLFTKSTEKFSLEADAEAIFSLVDRSSIDSEGTQAPK